MVDEHGFEATSLPGHAVAVDTESSGPPTRTTYRLRDEQVDGHVICTDPCPDLAGRGHEPGGAHHIVKPGIVGQNGGVEDQIRIRRIRRHGKFSLAGVQVDGLRANQQYRVPMFVQRSQGIQEDSSGADVDRGRSARHPHAPASIG